MKKILVVSLIGIPASGKTTLARRLVESSREGSLNAGIVVITFDDFIKLDFDNIESGDYKSRRENLLKNVEDLIQELMEAGWSSFNSLKIDERNFNFIPNAPILIVLDDNMYFRSMRQRVRAICKKFQCQHFQIFLKSSLEDAKMRNFGRQNSVPEAIIEKIFKNLEEPQNPRTIFIDQDYHYDELLKKIHDRIENPEIFAIEEVKPPQQQSLLHEADIITRKELTAKIQSLKGEENFSQICADLNIKRKEFLEKLKSQNLSLDDLESLKSAFQCYLNE